MGLELVSSKVKNREMLRFFLAHMVILSLVKRRYVVTSSKALNRYFQAYDL